MDYRAAYNVGQNTKGGRIQEVRVVDSDIDGLKIDYWLENGGDWVKESQIISDCIHQFHWTLNNGQGATGLCIYCYEDAQKLIDSDPNLLWRDL